MQWFSKVSRNFRKIQDDFEFFWGVDFVGALATNFELVLCAFFPVFGLVIVAFLSSLSSSRIVQSFLHCMVIVGSIEVWFCKLPQKPPKKIRSSNAVRFPVDC